MTSAVDSSQAEPVRWQALFADLEAQAEQADRSELDAEVRDRSRREIALLRTVDRLGGAVGRVLVVHVHGQGAVEGRLERVGPDWLLLEEPAGREVLVPLDAVLGVRGLSGATRSPAEQGRVEARLDLRHALRGLSRSRSPVQLGLRDGSAVSGTVDRVGADHVEIAEHAVDQPRRAASVTGTRLVPAHALAVVRRLSGGRRL